MFLFIFSMQKQLHMFVCCVRVRVRVLMSSSLKCRALRRIPRTHPQHPVCRICCCWLRPACVFLRMFLRLVLVEVMNLRPRKVLRMLQILCRLCSFLIIRIFFVIILRVSFFVRRSSYGVALRFCMSCRSDSSWSLFVIVDCRGVALPVCL